MLGTLGVGVTVVEPHRRRGVGSALLRRVLERAAERGDLRIRLEVDLAVQPLAEAFLLACGFRCLRVVQEMEGDLDLVRQPLIEMRAPAGRTRQTHEARTQAPKGRKTHPYLVLGSEVSAQVASADSYLLPGQHQSGDYCLQTGSQPCNALICMCSALVQDKVG